MSKIRISVIVPTYHRNDLLAKCLERLALGVQTLPAEQYEVIVTDDGYQTTAEEMIRERYPWAKWVAGSRKGPAANRNNGARHAQGEFLAFTDDDCLPSSSWLSAFSLAIAPDIHVYEGKTTCEAGVRSPLEHAPANLTGGYLWSCNMMIRASYFQYLGGFDENFPYPHLEDVDLRERIKLTNNVFLFVEQAVIDHPPKRLPWGDKLGASHESEVFYWRKFGERYKFKKYLLFLILKVRLKKVFNYPLSLDSFLALVSLFVELIYVIYKMNIWHKKYQD